MKIEYGKPKDCGHDDNLLVVTFICRKCGFKECAECQYRAGSKCFQCGGEVKEKQKE